MKVLDVGAGEAQMAKHYWPEAEIFSLDADPATHPDLLGDLFSIPAPDGEYDRVLCSHVLEHVEYNRVVKACVEMGRVLAEDGELHVFVPSLEWAARQVLSEKMSPITIMHLYGLQSTPWQYHKAGFTLILLRQVVTQAGLKVAAAQRATYWVTGTTRDGKDFKYPAEQHYVVGVKRANHVDNS